MSSEDLQRGDIIYNISSIIALPGESVEMNKGQIYINNRKLETFYGAVTKYGFTEEEYIAYMQEENPDYELSDKDTVFNRSMEKLEVPTQHVFVIGDNWSRSVDSRHFGPLPLERVEGEVIGVTKEYDSKL